MKEMNMKQLIKVTGGTVNDNYSPDAYTDNLDEILNGEKYDTLAQWIADYLNGDNVRTREVDNCIDIYDCEI